MIFAKKIYVVLFVCGEMFGLSTASVGSLAKEEDNYNAS